MLVSSSGFYFAAVHSLTSPPATLPAGFQKARGIETQRSFKKMPHPNLTPLPKLNPKQSIHLRQAGGLGDRAQCNLPLHRECCWIALRYYALLLYYLSN